MAVSEDFENSARTPLSIVIGTLYMNIPGSDIIANKKHFDACILRIQDKWKNQGFSFSFHTVSTSKVMKKLKCLKVKKAVGFDGILAKLIKIASPVL